MPATAAAIGLPPELVATQAGAPDPTALAFINSLIEKAAFVDAIDEAWAMMAVLVALGLLTVPLFVTRVYEERGLLPRTYRRT